ncbi:MAG: helix-turn-helix transcriptional regulator [Proteobacteria bacterium]|nr:helix-turn-helix transcriptional regulator [Pseudomonadota bacterium]
MSLGDLLKKRRKERRLTLSDVGAALGLANGNFIGMVERGERMPSDDRLLQVADVLELDGRELLAMKYAATHGAAAEVLLAPPEPELPRMRKLLLECCDRPKVMDREFARGERTAIERVVFGALLEYVILPGLDSDRYAPRRLRDRVNKHRRKNPDDPMDPWWFEEEAELFVPWLRSQFVGWDLDLPTLTVTIRHTDEGKDQSTIPLVDRELRSRMLASVDAAPTLAQLLAAEGLSEADVSEILELVEFKKMRAAKSSA